MLKLNCDRSAKCTWAARVAAIAGSLDNVSAAEFPVETARKTPAVPSSIKIRAQI